MDDTLMFAAEDDPCDQRLGSWKLMIVDDEPEVHAVTRLALADLRFQGKPLSFVSAYSGAEARQLILEHPDTAIVLLDVVMESDDAGLQVARFIREQAGNSFCRIILRTGQPGQAPERQVILDYDINDYKAKTELTATKLFTAIIASLRAYRDIMLLERNRQGLEKIIRAAADLFTTHKLEPFIKGLLQQLASVVGGSDEALYVTSLVAGDPGHADLDHLVVLAGGGEYRNAEGKPVSEVLSDEQRRDVLRAISEQGIVYGDRYVVAWCPGSAAAGSLLLLSGIEEPLNAPEQALIELFAKNVQMAWENLQLNQELENTQKELVMRLAEAVESRSREVGQHVKRVAEYSRLLGLAAGLSLEEAELLKLASPLHDLGKIAIPDQVLLKPGRLSSAERKVMEEHVQIGHDLLADSSRPILRAGSIVAREHHEHWDGQGYPDAKQGEGIHIFGRITALADVFDALLSSRVYKEAWTLEQTVAYINEQAGHQFDPRLVQIFNANLDKLLAVFNQYPDHS